MKINFNEIEEKITPNFQKGNGEFINRIYNDGVNKILKGCLKKGSSIGLHDHLGTSEIVYIISGTGIMTTDGVEEVLNPGDVTYCPLNHNHTFRNDNEEDLVFFAVVPNHKVA